MKKRLIKGVVGKLEPGPSRYIVWDDRLSGFGVRVGPSGEKTFVLKYRFPSGRAGKVRWYTIGAYSDDLPPDRARERAELLRGDIRRGVDPMGELQEQRREAEAERNAPTVEHVCRDWIERVAKKKNRTWKEAERVVNRYVVPKLGSRLIASIRRADINDVLDEIEETAPVQAERVLMTLRTIFNWYALRDEEFVSPIVRGMSRISWKKRARKRVLTDDEVRVMWLALDALEPPFRQIVRFLLLSAQRRSEAALARRPEVGHNSGIWTIPPERYKTGVENVVPLPAKALAQIAEAEKHREDHRADDDDRNYSKDFIFTTTGTRPFSGFGKAKARLDAEMERLMCEAAGVGEDHNEPLLKPWRLHDLRRTSKTLMARIGVPREISERVLGHVIPGVEGVYDRHDYLAEKKDALERLAEEVERIVEGREPKVIPFARVQRGA